MRARLLVAWVVAALAGCVPAPWSGGNWQPVTLPPRVHASSLAIAGDDVLVGGQSAEGPAPRLLRVRAGAVAGEFRLQPADPNAETADVVSVTADGDDVYAIGSVVAGAHANPRLTVWDGSVGEGRLTSHPQEFFTFGGHDAGPLLGTVVVEGEPVIFGSRVGPTGPYGLVWTREGNAWRARPAASELGSVPDRELGFSGLSALGRRLAVAGDELGLAGGLNQQPVLFVGTVAGAWRQVPLPVPEGLGRVPGQLSRATSVACPRAGNTCWATGWVRGHALAWPVTIPEGDDPRPGTAAVLPGEPPPGNNPATLVALTGNRPAVLTNATTPSLQFGCPGGWRALPAPPGRATAVVAAPDALYAVAGESLWRLPMPTC